jgi:hypothetical protein
MEKVNIVQHFICLEVHPIQKNLQTPSKSNSFLIISTKLKGHLQPNLRSFD